MNRTAATPTLRTLQAQPQKRSVRTSDAMRRRLERATPLRASITGTNVSTSAIAKPFRESAREDRLDRVDSVDALMRHASDRPDIRMVWDAWAREYGER